MNTTLEHIAAGFESADQDVDDVEVPAQLEVPLREDIGESTIALDGISEIIAGSCPNPEGCKKTGCTGACGGRFTGLKLHYDRNV